MMWINVCDVQVAEDDEEEENELPEDEEEEMEEEEPYFPHELTSPDPMYEYGRDVLSPRSVSEPSPDCSRASSELTFSEYVILLFFLFKITGNISLCSLFRGFDFLDSPLE